MYSLWRPQDSKPKTPKPKAKPASTPRTAPGGRTKFHGWVWSWQQRYNFGKPLPVPWKQTYSVWAMTRDEAQIFLQAAAKKDGHLTSINLL